MTQIFKSDHRQTSLFVQPFNNTILKIINIFITLLFFPALVYAHGLFVSSDGKKLHASFDDQSPASGAVVCVVGEDGIVIIRDTLDEKGTWVLPKDVDGVPKLVIVEAPGGHRTQIAWSEVSRGTSKRFFDYFSIRIAMGIVILLGSGIILKRLLKLKFKI